MLDSQKLSNIPEPRQHITYKTILDMWTGSPRVVSGKDLPKARQYPEGLIDAQALPVHVTVQCPGLLENSRTEGYIEKDEGIITSHATKTTVGNETET